jgi:flagellin
MTPGSESFQEKKLSFSINTNIASLQAQNYLEQSSNFQSKTINEVTSGLRIVNSGDDAAGLAIANGLRSDQAVLNQGIQNGNDGLATLQTIDGGMDNISTLLDRARTLATESASGTFSGDRTTTNSEFQSVISEINRQAQSIGLNQGGQYAQDLSVFIGGGKGSTSAQATANGTIDLDLSKSAVDAQSLGLAGTQVINPRNIDPVTGAVNATNSGDIGSGSQTTVQTILANATNQASEASAGYTSFTFSGSGFGGSNSVSISVNLAGVTDTTTLATAINQAIATAGNGSTQSATAFKNAGITASIVTDANGGSHLAFNSSSNAFQVNAGDLTANALMGNVTVANNNTNGQGLAMTSSVTGGNAVIAAGNLTAAQKKDITFQFTGANLSSPVNLDVNLTAGTTVAAALQSLTSAVANNAALKAAGITVSTATAGSALVFQSSSGQQFSVGTAGDTGGVFGMGSYLGGGGGSNFSSTSVTAAAAIAAAGGTQNFEISMGDGTSTPVDFSVTAAASGTEQAAIDAINTAIANAGSTNQAFAQAGFLAKDNGGNIEITNNTGTAFRLGVDSGGGTDVFGFGKGGALQSTNVNTSSLPTVSSTFDSNGAYQSSVLSYTTPQIGTDSQTISLSANSASGTEQSLSVNLNSTNAATLNQAIDTINAALQQSNNVTLQNIVAVKDNSNGNAGIKFISTAAFQASIGTTTDGSMVNGTVNSQAVQGSVQSVSSAYGQGGTADISTQAGAEAAVNALALAVQKLGTAQAAVGKGENVLNYAVSLAQSQSTNEAAAESQIRDANLAQEAANLTKAQILVQAGTAALAQANSAPQQLLALLQGH